MAIVQGRPDREQRDGSLPPFIYGDGKRLLAGGGWLDVDGQGCRLAGAGAALVDDQTLDGGTIVRLGNGVVGIVGPKDITMLLPCQGWPGGLHLIPLGPGLDMETLLDRDLGTRRGGLVLQKNRSCRQAGCKAGR